MVWLNGPFGSGKTTTAEELVASTPAWRLFDPEFVGFMLRAQLADSCVADFQQLPSWRRLTPIVADEIARATNQSLVIVQTVLNQQYWEELAEGLRALGYTVRLVLVEADEPTLRRRISEDEVLHRAAGWRLQHLPTYFDAREQWLGAAADLIIDTTTAPPGAAARLITEAISRWSAHETTGDSHAQNP
ncbi:AAA family ATPase [Nocardia higoensis]|uniref:AAA family ATPase n=1 Tax=Nocardia higoensis TaxID=228599 RepID=UPI0002F7347C|nr:AAA family ATPase [Nocardia higoensis]